MDIYLGLELLITLILVTILVIIVFPKKDAPKWNGVSLNKIKRFLFHNSKMIKAWDYTGDVYVFPYDGKILTHIDAKPNTLFCIGSEESYNQYLVTNTKKVDNLFLLDVDYIGRVTPRKGVSISINV